MASATEYFDHVLTLCRAICASVNLEIRDERPERALLKLTARYGDFDLYISDIVFPDGSHKYAYYVLQQQKVISGFDNAPDPEVLKLKYGAEYTQHRLESIPHVHGTDKTHALLTDIMDFEQFLAWVQTNLPVHVDL
jgi:hypothetical protein